MWILLGGVTDLKDNYSIVRQTEKDILFPFKKLCLREFFRKKKVE